MKHQLNINSTNPKQSNEKVSIVSLLGHYRDAYQEPGLQALSSVDVLFVAAPYLGSVETSHSSAGIATGGRGGRRRRRGAELASH